MSIGVSIWGRWGEMRSVAGTSVRDNAITNTPAARSSGQAMGQTTADAVRTGPAPSTAAKSRSPRHRGDHVARPANSAIHAKRDK
jgi:hypothetical protein